MSMIAVHDLTKCFDPSTSFGAVLRRRQTGGGIWALRGVRLEVEAGEIFGLLGPNGAGKTTLVKILSTLITPTAGTALIAGIDIKDVYGVRRVIGFATSDERSFYARLSGRKNLLFFATLYDIPSALARKRVDEVLEFVGLAEKADLPYQTYSSGQKQRLTIARAILHKPRVLFLDEPTRSLDPTATARIHRLISHDLRNTLGMTVFLTTQRLNEAEKLCDRVAIISQGRIRACGTLTELRRSINGTRQVEIVARGFTTDHLGLLLRDYPQVKAVLTDDVWSFNTNLDSRDDLGMVESLVRCIIQLGGSVSKVLIHEIDLDEVFTKYTEY